jgi:hypothetical protein
LSFGEKYETVEEKKRGKCEEKKTEDERKGEN